MDVVGGTAALIVDWGVQCSVYVQVCGCSKGISSTPLIRNAANASARGAAQCAAALRQYSAHSNGSKSTTRKNSQRKSRMNRDLLLKILFSSLIIKR